jgi:hypothetical protein
LKEYASSYLSKFKTKKLVLNKMQIIGFCPTCSVQKNINGLVEKNIGLSPPTRNE